jgi:muconolactone delta-isomerase
MEINDSYEQRMPQALDELEAVERLRATEEAMLDAWEREDRIRAMSEREGWWAA